MDINYDVSRTYDDTWSYWNTNIAWGEVIVNASRIAEDSRFKNYYRDYIDCHKLVVITYPSRGFSMLHRVTPQRILRGVLGETSAGLGKTFRFDNIRRRRIEFKGSYSRKYQRPRKFRGQRLF